MAKETISQTEGLCKEVANCIRNAYDRGYKQGVNDGSLDVKMRVDGVYEKGLNDVWECAKKIACDKSQNGYSLYTLKEIFGTASISDIFSNFSPSEAITRIKEYEEKQKQADDVKVGDEVIWNDHEKGIVIEIIDYNLRGFTSRLCPFEWRKEFCRRTGRHFNQIAEVLEQLKEEEYETK